MPSGRYTDVIERLKPGAAEAGEIVDLDGKVLGAHSGIIHFTVGQRRGLGFATGAPLYVVRLDAERRRVVVGPREALRTSRIVLRDVNWIGDGDIEEALADDRREVFVKVRSTRPPQAAWLRHARWQGYEVELVDGEHGVSPGQACVFYDAGDGQARVLGGGFIKRRRQRRTAAHATHGDGGRALINSIPNHGGRLSTRSCAKISTRAYARWAPVYDLVFGAVFDRGRRAAIAAAEQACGPRADAFSKSASAPGFRCPTMRASNRLVGVDLSEPMLRKAQERVAEHGLANVEALAVMDAERLALPDQSFDVVVAQFVITAVPNPEATLDEFARVIKPGGEIVLVNHIGAEAGRARLFELCFAPLARRLGWRPEFRFRRLADWAARHGGVRVIERRAMPPLGHFSLIRFERLNDDAQRAA